MNLILSRSSVVVSPLKLSPETVNRFSVSPAKQTQSCGAPQLIVQEREMVESLRYRGSQFLLKLTTSATFLQKLGYFAETYELGSPFVVTNP